MTLTIQDLETTKSLNLPISPRKPKSYTSNYKPHDYLDCETDHETAKARLDSAILACWRYKLMAEQMARNLP